MKEVSTLCIELTDGVQTVAVSIAENYMDRHSIYAVALKRLFAEAYLKNMNDVSKYQFTSYKSSIKPADKSL